MYFRSIRVLGAVLFTAGLGAGAAIAEPLNCQAYGVKAVAQQQQNKDMNCGLGGGAWSSDMSAHVNWCRTAKMADLVHEDNARADALRACVVQKNNAEIERAEQEQKQRQQIEICKSYARSSIEQHALNTARKCGFGGGAWTANYAGHFEWCLGASETAIIREGQARENQLIGCKAAQQASESNRCDDYAAIAVGQNASMVKRKCGFGGGVWSSNASSHKNWCLKVSPATAKKRQDSRANDLDNHCGKTVCRTTRSGFPKFSTTTRCRYVPNP